MKPEYTLHKLSEGFIVTSDEEQIKFGKRIEKYNKKLNSLN